MLDSQPSESTTKVLVVDGHSVTRHGMVLLCMASEGVEVIGEASDGNEAIQRVNELLPDVVLMEVDLPRRDGISATKQIRQDHPSVGVVVLTMHEDQETIFEAIKAGASGYLPKSATLDDIRSAVQAVAAGGSFLDPVQARKLLHQFNRYDDEEKAAADQTKAVADAYQLDRRERKIMLLLGEGLSSQQIASDLRVSEQTVNTYIDNIYRKVRTKEQVKVERLQSTDVDWDVFISHATEDKEILVRPLARSLQDLGLHVWYDEFELRLGDSLSRKIDIGLARSRFGVVVLSPAFFAKNWPQYELAGLVTRETSGETNLILPLWHNISKTEVMARSPALADKLARSTAGLAVEDIAAEIFRIIKRS
jgi:DNA-binding NarL/FixJ family response regulator